MGEQSRYKPVTYGNSIIYLEGNYSLSDLKEIIRLAEKRETELKAAMDGTVEKLNHG